MSRERQYVTAAVGPQAQNHVKVARRKEERERERRAKQSLSDLMVGVKNSKISSVRLL